MITTGLWLNGITPYDSFDPASNKIWVNNGTAIVTLPVNQKGILSLRFRPHIADVDDNHLMNDESRINFQNPLLLSNTLVLSNGVTPTPTPTRTPTPTITLIPCLRGSLGNLDCSSDGCIDTGDFELFRPVFGQSVSALSIPPTHYTPDLVEDSGNLIDTADYEIFRSNFGRCN